MPRSWERQPRDWRLAFALALVFEFAFGVAFAFVAAACFPVGRFRQRLLQDVS